MFNLIKNEIFKTFKKKGTLIFIFIMFLYSGFVIYMHTKDMFQVNVSHFDTIIDRDYDSEIKALNKKDANYYAQLIELSVDKDITSLAEKHKEKWNYEFLYNEYQNELYLYYQNKYIVKDKKTETKLLEKLDKYNNILNNNLELDYVNIKITNLKNDIKEAKKVKENKLEIEYLTNTLNLYQYRLDNKIKYDYSYLDETLTNQENNYNQNYYFDTLTQLSKHEKDEYKFIEAEIEKNEYILKNQVDLNDYKNLRAILIDFGDNYVLFIFLFAIMIAGTIFSNEFSKGTIKNLLITPYSRVKIFLAKFITMLLSLPFITILLLLFNILLGGLIFGFSSLNIPVMEFNYATNVLVQYNVFSYVSLVLLGIVPQILLLMTLSFLLTIIYPSASLGISIPFAGLIVSNIINALAVTYDVKLLRYFITLNWDFQQYIFGQSPFDLHYKHTSLYFSIIVCVVYFVVMFILALFIFKNKDIKNN